MNFFFERQVYKEENHLSLQGYLKIHILIIFLI